MSQPNTTKVNNLRRLSQLLDNAIPIPGTGYRIGLDPILGLLPGGGDTVAGALGAYIIIEAARMGLPRKVVGEMVGNIIFDSVVGMIPVLGDLFDVTWKANVRNMALLEKHLHITPKTQKSDLAPSEALRGLGSAEARSERLFLIGLALLLALIVIT